MSLSARSPLALAGTLLALALASCGEEDAQLLPGETAREITTNLDAVKQLADEGDCVGAESAALQVSEQIEELRAVDERLKQALRTGAARLNEVVVECEEAPTEAIAPAEIPTETERSGGDEGEDRDRGKGGEGEANGGADEGGGEDEGRGPPPAAEGQPSIPPSAAGKGEGPGGGEGEGESGAGDDEGEGGGEESSGGISPGSPAGEGE